MPKKSTPELDLTPETVENLVDETEIPVPKPGDKDFDWTVEYGTDDLFTYTFADGTMVALKPFDSIYSKTWLYKLRNAVSGDQLVFAGIDRGSCEAARRVLENLDPDTDGDPIDELFTAWSKGGTSHGDGDEGLTPGNSSG